MVDNSNNINKMNIYLPPQIIKHKETIKCKSVSWSWDSPTNLVGLNRIVGSLPSPILFNNKLNH